MRASGTAKKIGKSGLRLAAVLAVLQLHVAVAKVAGHSAATLGHVGNAGCAGNSTTNVAMSVGQTVLSMLDACVVSQLVHATGTLFTSDSIYQPVQSAVGLAGHALVTHLFSLLIQVLS